MLKIESLLPSGLLTIAEILEISEIIHNGGCGVLPTDTGYLFACDASNEEAIKNIFQIKGRRDDNPIHVAVADLEMAQKFGKFNEISMALFKKFFPGAVTVVVPKQACVSDLLVANTGNIGIRIPDEPLIIQLCSATQKPITATSVNLSQKPPLSNFDEILETFGSKIDFAVKTNRSSFLKPSTIVRIVEHDVTILREGSFEVNTILDFLEKIKN